MTSGPPQVEDYYGEGASPRASWRATLRSNWALPVALLALYPLGLLVEGGLLGNYERRIIMLAGINIILAVSLQLINGISGQFSLGHAGFMAIGAYLAAYPLKAWSNGMQNPAGAIAFYFSLALVVLLAGAALLGLFVLVRRSAAWHPSLPTVLLVALAAWFLADVARATGHGERAPPWFVWTHLIRLLTSLFHDLLGGLGPAMAAVSGILPQGLRPGASFLVAIAGGGLCAAVAGLIVGLPTLRLRGDYLAIATLGFAEIIRVVINNSEPLGRATGLIGIPRLTSFAWLYGAVIITVTVVWRLAHSSKGRSIAAVREDELAASAVGIDPTHHRVFAFVVGAFFAGVAGAMFAHLNTYLHPNEFGFQRSVEVVVMVVLAGLGSISGAVVTAIALTLLPELLRGVADWRMVLYSLLLIVMMLVHPQGLLGMRELWWTRRRPAPAGPRELGEGRGGAAAGGV